ncbi:uncharacterized protein LOC123314350 [Coccinella septempunctata]|uniref:uncharacterized protein LOC123314350 n=1 Tax=Coccinella septempunctata TaxID=41139 RepID=UPI001D06A38D|nr:uncharacterized protein LOC123314350 [Coccinella septempunctata]
MYGAFNPTGNHFIPGGVKYYSPMELSKICRQNQESPSARESENFLQLPRNGEIIEQERQRRHHQERDVDEKLRRKINKERRKSKREGKAGTSFGPYYMIANQEDEEKKERKHRRDKKKEFSELNYYDLQCLINDCNRDTSMPSNLKKDRNNEVKKHQRSHSTDQIPTKDVSSDQRVLRRPERPRSADRREDPQMEKNKEFFLKYYSQNQPNNPMPFYDQRAQHFMPPNQQTPIQHLPKKHKEKSKYRKKTLREEDMPEFVTLNQINEQTMNLRDEKFEQHKNKWDPEKNIRHHQQREFYGEYHQQHNRNNLDSQNNDHDLNTFTQNPEEYNKILHNYYQPPMTNEVGISKTKKKEKKKDRNKEHKKKENDKEYKALKKYMKRLAKEQKKETFYFTTKDNGEAVAPVPDKRQNKNKKYAEENMQIFEPDSNQNDALDTTRGNKHAKKEFIPLDLGVEEQEIAPKHRKTHDHKKQKTKRETMKRESAERMRSASLTIKDKHKNLNNILQKNDEVVEDMNGLKTKYKSETSLDSTTNDKNIVCIYQSKDSPDEKEDATTVKLTKKQECVSIETGKKYHKKEVPDNAEKEKERSPYNRTQTVLPTEHKKQMADILNTQERTLLFQKAMKRDFPSRPRPRLSRSRQRSSRYLAKLEDAKYNNSSIKIDEKPTKEVHCYDVGTSTILDNNFGEVLELLKGEPSVIPPCTNKKRSVFHVKKNTSREELDETSRKTNDNIEQTTLGIVVKGIEPPKKIETSKVRSRFKFPSEKTKVNRLECKILSVVAIAPTKFDNEQDEIDRNLIKTQSTPQMQHETISTEIRNPSSDKRLERLLKYYKVEARSKISHHANDSHKSIKELIADKLSDYLKKLQENGSDDMLQIQTDDPKVVKLVLPIEFSGLDCTKTPVPQQKSSDHVTKKPKESFSDLYINYSAGNNAEDEDFFNLEVPKDISVKTSKLVQEANKSHSENFNSHQSFDSKLNEPKSNQNSFNLIGTENRREFTLNPRMTENRKSTEGDLTKEYSFSEKQMSQNSFPKLPVQNTQLNIDSNNNYRKHEDEYYNSANSPIVNVSERYWKENMNGTEQAYSTGRENSEYIRSSPSNMVENTHQQQMNEMIMLNLTQEANSNAPAPVSRQSNEKVSMGIPKSGNIECKNYFQVERGRITDLYNIVEDRVDMKELTEVNIQRPSYNYQQQLSRNGGLQLNAASSPDANDVKKENEQRLSYQYNSQPLRNEGLPMNFGYSIDGDDINRENDQRTLYKYQQQLPRNEGLLLKSGSSPDGYDINRQSEQRPPCKHQPQPLRSDGLQLNSELPPDSCDINQENEHQSYKYQLQPLKNEGLQMNLGSSPDGNENEQRSQYKFQSQPSRNEGFQLNAASSPDGIDVNREKEPRQLHKYQLQPLRNEGLQFNSGSSPDGNDKYCENEQKAFSKHQSQPSRNEGLQLNLGSEINNENDYSHFSTPRQKVTLNKSYDEMTKYTCKKENENSLPGNGSGMLVNKNHSQQYGDEDISFSFNQNQRNPCVADDSGKNNSQMRQIHNYKSSAEHIVPLKKKTETSCTNERKKIGKTNISQSQQQPVDTTAPSKKYEYFEIPPPRSKSNKKPTSGIHDGKLATTEHKAAKTSQIPKRIMSSSKTMDKDDKQSPLRTRKEDSCAGYENLGSITWDYQKDESALDNSLQKCLHWNIRNSETIVMSEFNDEVPNKTSEIGRNSTLPKKSNIPISKKDQNKTQANRGKSPPAGKDKTPTMLLTKTFKPPGQSSYEKRKMYDTRIRKNVKRRSLSESSPPCKIPPLVYEVRYCNVYNQCSPFDPAVLGGSKSDQSLSIFSSEFNANDFKKSIESLTTAPSCFLKSNKYKEEDLTTEPSCFLKGNNYERDEMNLSTDPSCLLKESQYCRNKQQYEVCLSTEPSCLLKESRYKFTSGQKRVPRSMKRIPIEENQDYEETCSNYSSKSDRIKELIKENLLYVKYPTPNKKIKPPGETRKRKKRVEKEKSHIGSKISNKPKSKTKITLRCTKKSSKENGKRLKIIARLNEKRDDEESDERPENQDDHISLCQNLTKLSIDKVNGNEFRVSFEELKLGSVEDEVTFGEKSGANISADNDFANDRESIDNSVSSISTVINCEACSSVTSNESKETVKERELIHTSADDSGYLTKGADLNNSGTTIDSTNDGKACCSNIFKGFSSKLSEKKSGIPKYKFTSTEENSKWNQKDLVKLRIQLLFPHVYDDFELLETAQNTDLIKYYVESENDKLKEAIDSISQKEEMNTKSRSVISLPSVKVIPEEPSELPINGDNTSEYSSVSQEGGFYNYQKFIAQNNICYSANVLSKLNKSEVVGDGSDTATLKDNDISETASVNSCSVSSVKSGASMKKSVVELFKLRPSSAKKSSSSMFSDNETLVEVNECNSMNINISDEEFFNNFHQIMSMECQKFAKKVRDQSKANEDEDENPEYEEIPLDCLLKNKNLNSESSEDYLEQDYQLASDEIGSKENESNESTKKESSESFKSVTCIKENVVKQKKSSSKWQKLLKKKSSVASNSKMNLDFYPQEKMSILDMIQSVQATSISDDAINRSPRDKVLNVISSGEVSKQSEKQFFDNLLAFYDKESELIKKLIRDDEFFSSLIEAIRNTEDSTQLIFQRDSQKKARKEKKKGILSRFFRWKEKKSTETLFDNFSIGKSLEFAKSMSNDITATNGESCYSFYKDLDDYDKDVNEVKHPNSEYLQQLAYKAKCHLEPMVKATISNRHISDKIKLAGFLKMLDMVAKGDFTFLNTGDNKTLEEKLKEHVAQMFEKVYRIANHEVIQKDSILDNDKIQLLKMLVTKYHMGIESHLNILSIYIGRSLIETKAQLEDAIIFLMGQDSQDINLEQFEKNCGISST